MKFTKLPLNGASWAEELLYTFDTEFAEPIDVIVDIINSDTREIIGQQRLRGVTTGSINIAPYIRSKMQALQVAPSLDRPISISPSSIVISLRCNGTWSDSRLFFRATYDPLRPAIISQYVATQRMKHDGIIALTATATNIVAVELKTTFADHTSTMRYTLNAAGRPVDIVIPLGSNYREARSVTLTLTCDSIKRTITYNIEQMPEGRQLLWYNSRGGIETYPFATALRVSDTAHVRTVATKEYTANTLISQTSVVRLLSAFERRNELERIADIINSPDIFEATTTALKPVELNRRTVEYDKHGTIHQASIEIREYRKGGRR